jgi:hypothetical protein
VTPWSARADQWGRVVSESAERKWFFHFQKMLLSAETYLIHSKIISAPKFMKKFL